MYPPAQTVPVSTIPVSPSKEPVPEIFIGRIPPGVAKETLEAQFTPYGATNFRVLEGRGCAFCSFSSWAAAETAVQALNGLKLDTGLGEGINVKFADVKGAPKGKSQQHPKVFIGNIGPGATEDVIREVCQQFGFVTNAKIFARSADAKPCAFVTFTSFTEAELCISALNGVEHAMAVESKVLNVRLADALGRKTPPGPAFVAPNAAQLAMPVTRAREWQTMGSGPEEGARQAPCGGGSQFRPGTSGGTGPKVFIGGLPEAATEDFVWGMMAPFGDVTEAKIHRKVGAKPCGFARFAQQSEAEHAIATLGECGRYTVRRADDVKPGSKRPSQMGTPAIEAYDDDYYNQAPTSMTGAARVVRRLQ
mmetsp:Transcript_88941/g.206995  ORF Transcript_88941/g.206995 Transcript_88941/m.206995 type:complete len:364 (-) Transcript_88941:142-1233(-)